MTGPTALGGRGRGAVVADVTARLGSAAEARWLVEHVTGDRAGPGAAGTILDDRQLDELAALAARRSAGEPLQYVLGRWPFRAVELTVDPRALVPRPETEQVVEAAIGALRRMAGTHSRGPTVVDLGTGTGAIALSLAVELAAEHPDLTVWATDADPDALALATENLERVAGAWPGVAVERRVHLAAGSWYGALGNPLRGRVDLVVANPPYVAEDEWPALDSEVRWEPRQALVAGSGTDGTPGLADVEAVLAGAPDWLAPGGAVVVELAPHQAGAAARLAARLGFEEVGLARDLAGRHRAVVARR